MISATYTAHQVGWRYSAATLDSYLTDAASGSPTVSSVVQGETLLSYAALDRQAESLSAGLQLLGVAAGSVVTAQMPNWWEAAVAIQAVLRMACVINPVVPIYREAEMSFILKQAHSRVVFIGHRYRGFDYVEMMQRVLDSATDRPLVVVVRPETTLPDGFVAFDDVWSLEPLRRPDKSPQNIAVLLYTSGTTAEPKGVLHSHETIGWEIESMIRLLQIDSEDVIFMPSPVGHVTGLLYGVLMPARLSIPSVLMDIWEPGRAAEIIEENRCTVSVGATPFLTGLRDAYASRGSRSSLRAYLAGGSDVPPTLIADARSVLGAHVARGYGSSEVPTLTFSSAEDDARFAIETDGRPVEVGKVRIDNPDAEGEGEILARAPDMFLGYLDASLNADAFTVDGWFRTGDLGRLDEGAVVVTGRRKDIIIRGGENISAKEVENIMYEQPLVAEVANVGMPDPLLGERSCAFVVPRAGARLTLTEMVTWLESYRFAKQKLPERLVLVDELPKTASGKVQKFVLRKNITDSLARESRLSSETENDGFQA